MAAVDLVTATCIWSCVEVCTMLLGCCNNVFMFSCNAMCRFKCSGLLFRTGDDDDASCWSPWWWWLWLKHVGFFSFSFFEEECFSTDTTDTEEKWGWRWRWGWGWGWGYWGGWEWGWGWGWWRLTFRFGQRLWRRVHEEGRIYIGLSLPNSDLATS